jgi:DNA-binding transcriptional ArsR family regulator
MMLHRAPAHVKRSAIPRTYEHSAVTSSGGRRCPDGPDARRCAVPFPRGPGTPSDRPAPGRGEARVFDLTGELSLAQSTVSAHLACLRDCGTAGLRDCGLVDVRPAARRCTHSASPRCSAYSQRPRPCWTRPATRWRCARTTGRAGERIRSGRAGPATPPGLLAGVRQHGLDAGRDRRRRHRRGASLLDRCYPVRPGSCHRDLRRRTA